MSAAHPLDPPHIARRLGVLRALCRGLAAGLVVLATGSALVGYFALGGQPVAGRGVTVGGLSAVTLGTGAVVLAGLAAAGVAAGLATRSGLQKLVAESPADDAEGLVAVFAGATFAEFAVAEGSGVLAAVLLHMTADPLMLAWVAAALAYLAVKFPTTARAKAWYAGAAEQLAQLRSNG